MSRLWLLAVLALGCTPELAPIHWEPIDVEALREAIAHPTGTVDEASAKQVAARIAQRSEPYRVLADYLHAVFEDSESGAMGRSSDRSSDGGPPWVIPRALGGTSVYVLVACPGSLDADAEPFTHGTMRIDSPTLDADVISTFAVHGQLRLRFAACEIDDYMFEGVAPAFHDSDPSELGFVPELEVVRIDQIDQLDQPEQRYELREPVLWNVDDRVSALFELSSGETLALDWYVGQIELRLRGRDGELICTIIEQSLECVAP